MPTAPPNQWGWGCRDTRCVHSLDAAAQILEPHECRKTLQTDSTARIPTQPALAPSRPPGKETCNASDQPKAREDSCNARRLLAGRNAGDFPSPRRASTGNNARARIVRRVAHLSITGHG